MAGYDKLVDALETAADIWEKAPLALKDEKLGFAAQLHRFAVFSIPQIAKIVRMNSRYIYEELQPNCEKGGRFEPESLSTLTRIRRLQMRGAKVPHALVRTGLEGGTSFSCMVALTRISYSEHYSVARKFKEEQELKKLEGKTLAADAVGRLERNAEIFKLRENGLTSTEIAHAVGLDRSRVNAILRGA